MPKFADVVGAMLSDVARARVRADLEAVRIAETYSRDPLLKHLPVPRFRLPELTVDVPMLVAAGGEVTAEAAEAWSVGELSGTEIRQAVREGLEASEVSLTEPELAKVSGLAVDRSKLLFTGEARTRLSPGRVSTDLTSAVVDAVREIGGRDTSEDQLRSLESKTRMTMSTLVARKIAPSPSLDVIVGASEVKAYADGGNVMRLRLTIAEDAYEVVAGPEGDTYTLVPE